MNMRGHRLPCHLIWNRHCIILLMRQSCCVLISYRPRVLSNCVACSRLSVNGGPLRTTQCEMSPSHLLRPQYLHARGRSATTHVISSLCCIDCAVISVCYDYSMRGCELLRDGRFAFLKWAYITRGNIAYADRSLDSVSLVVFVTVSLSVFAL